MDDATQKELEQPAKYYQLLDVKKDIKGLKTQVETAVTLINGTLKDINQQTKGVVTYEQMTAYVDKRIDEQTKPLWEFKASVSKLAWIFIGLLAADIITRLYK